MTRNHETILAYGRVLYKLNFALKVSSKFLFQKKWNFSTLVAFQVRLLSRETTGTVQYPVRQEAQNPKR